MIRALLGVAEARGLDEHLALRQGVDAVALQRVRENLEPITVRLTGQVVGRAVLLERFLGLARALLLCEEHGRLRLARAGRAAFTRHGGGGGGDRTEFQG